MGFLIGLLTVVMVLDCIVLMFLVLIQLPKKEAGMGLAFGGAATDALFGAGSGTVLTKITRYAATIFFVLAVMLKEFSVRYVILGHSERRQYQKESDALISKKAQAVHAASLKPIVCVGETLAERESGQTQKVLETQVRGSLAGLSKEQMAETILAYEPVWAIGTGKTATTAQAQEAQSFIRGVLGKMFDESVARRVRIQYGGSVKPSNARELMSQKDVDGALVGGASLEVRSFADIVKNSI